MNLCRGEAGHLISPIHHLEIRVEEDVINKTAPASSVGLPEDGMNALPPFVIVMYLVCSLSSIDFCKLGKDQDCKQVRHLQRLWILCSSIRQKTSALFVPAGSPNSTSLLLVT